MTMDFEAANNVVCELGESPVFDDRRQLLWYCDIVKKRLISHSFNDQTTRIFSFDSDVGSLGLARSGRLVIALRNEVGLFDPESCEFHRLAAIEPGRRETRTNDGKVGPDGAFWVGTMDDRETSVKEPIGSLYRVTMDGAEKKIDGLIVSNGLAFSPDGTMMFHSDSHGKWIDRWVFDANSGEISARRRIVDLDEATGRPDGGATDADGCYWSAGISAGRLNRFSPEGEFISKFPVPVVAPTMLCFGGPDMKTLFVTSLRTNRSPELLARYPLTGKLIVARSEIAGSPVTRFNDS